MGAGKRHLGVSSARKKKKKRIRRKKLKNKKKEKNRKQQKRKAKKKKKKKFPIVFFFFFNFFFLSIFFFPFLFLLAFRYLGNDKERDHSKPKLKETKKVFFKKIAITRGKRKKNFSIIFLLRISHFPKPNQNFL